jgi:hypothetical protein
VRCRVHPRPRAPGGGGGGPDPPAPPAAAPRAPRRPNGAGWGPHPPGGRGGGGGALTAQRPSPRRPGLHYGYVCVQNAGGALQALPEADLTRLAGYPSCNLLPAGCSVRPKPDPQASTLRLVLFAEGLAWFLPPRLGGVGAGGVLAAAPFDRAPADGFDHRWRPDAATYSAVSSMSSKDGPYTCGKCATPSANGLYRGRYVEGVWQMDIPR